MPVVEDGAVDLERFEKAPVKVLHLLQNPTKAEGPLPELVRKTVKKEHSRFNRRSLFYKLGCRSFAALKQQAPDVSRKSDDEIAEALLSAAIVNLAYEEPAPHAGDLRVWAREKYDRWHGQITLLKPQLILCGGTFDAARTAINERSTNASE